jgi:hypothetical protein
LLAFAQNKPIINIALKMLLAEKKSKDVFEAVEARGLIIPSKWQQQLACINEAKDVVIEKQH